MRRWDLEETWSKLDQMFAGKSLYRSILSQKSMVKKSMGFGRNLVSDGLFLIFVDLITVTIQRLTDTLNSYINPYSVPHMHCRLLMLLLGVFISAVCFG
jgi:hypothetical protein